MEPVLLAPDAGEVITAGRERLVRIKASRDDLTITENRYGPGQAGPEPHVHEKHADCFWVTAGELTFKLGPDEQKVVVGAGSWLMVPPNLIHSFVNAGDENALFLNVHAPDAGFAEWLRALGRGDADGIEWDSVYPPEDGGLPASEAVVRGPGEGETVRLGHTRVCIKAGKEHAPGSLSLAELVLEPDFPGPLAHHHETHADAFYVIEGTLSLLAGTHRADLPEGAFALMPPGVVHTFFNHEHERAKVLNLMTPAGFEHYFREAADELLPGKPLDPERAAELAKSYDFHPDGSGD